MRSKYLILIPTYNEKKNINLILGKINKKFNQKHDILFIDDNSNDGTKEIDYNSLIVHAEDEDAAKKMILNQYENSKFLKIDKVEKLWKY